MREKHHAVFPSDQCYQVVMRVERNQFSFTGLSSLLENPRYTFYCSLGCQADTPSSISYILDFTVYRQKDALFGRSQRSTEHGWCDYIIQHFSKAFSFIQHPVLLFILSLILYEKSELENDSPLFF